MSGLGRVGGFSPTPLPDPGSTDAADAAGAAGGTSSAAASGSASPGNRTFAASTARTSGAADVWAAIAKGRGSAPTPPGVNLDASGTRRPVALGQNGRFTPTPGIDASQPKAIADGLFHAASLIDDSKGNLFEEMRMPDAGRAKMLAHLKADLGSVAVGKRPPPGMTDLQALQMRSSGATVLLELMTAKGTPAAQKREALTLYRDMLSKETNATLKDGMALHLYRMRESLPADLRKSVESAKEIIAPQKPPYDSWFKNGNEKVDVSWSAGSESLQDDVKLLKDAGFKVKSESWDKTVLEKTYDVNGKKTTFSVSIRPFRSDMFKDMNDPNAEMVVYTGHSNWGRNMRDSLSGFGNAPASGGKDKLVLSDLCVGKGEMQMFRDKFPQSDLITTYTSSYFVESGDGEEPDSEGIHAILNTFEGIAKRRSYDQIAEAVREDNPWQWEHDQEGIDNNYIFPSDVATRRKVLDSDHDGQADVFDRLIDFSTVSVKEDTAREFQPIDQGRKADDLVGTKVHFAAMTVNRLTIYSELFHPKNSDSKVVPGGYFDPKPGETDMFRFASTTVDGKKAVVLQMSSRYAHMSEEALRMAACFEYNNFMAKQRGWSLDKADTNISGMILAQHSLSTDSGHRDDVVWKEFCKAYRLPEIPLSTIERYKEVDHDWYSGSRKSISEMKKTLTPAVLDALKKPEAGRVG
jgi:hypothetical protein